MSTTQTPDPTQPPITAREPLAVRAAVVALAGAVLHLLVMLEVIHLTPEQEAQAGLVITLAATAAVVVFTRGKVTPTEDPRDENGNALAPAGGSEGGA